MDFQEVVQSPTNHALGYAEFCVRKANFSFGIKTPWPPRKYDVAVIKTFDLVERILKLHITRSQYAGR